MMSTLTPYIFPVEARLAIGVAVANRLKEVLETGHPGLDLPGLEVEPQFINRKGAGGGRDVTSYIKAVVKMPDDVDPGGPYVELVGIEKRGEESWESNGQPQSLMTCEALFDCCANQFLPEALSIGIDARTAHAVLGGHVEALLSNYEGMTEWGFCEPNVTTSVPPVFTPDGTPREFHFALQLSFEIYVQK